MGWLPMAASIAQHASNSEYEADNRILHCKEHRVMRGWARLTPSLVGSGFSGPPRAFPAWCMCGQCLASCEFFSGGQGHHRCMCMAPAALDPSCN